ncbi:P-loop containing nucleoside triphosphate hydrolase protein [Lasiosphaeris hirsuta]|uniref:P-loop containing nucleoside triphosphate hydrolase protein n=1 Tax=Lasiosphaeris hirsuta TaxID=260670 RepID=A0AA39ZX81_9PEZI|nr:P-loop containing nucleoside triphosphate hydrolase protein [Lasiosphaeris hirsuta]
MTDLLSVLPHFPVGEYASLIPTLEKHGLSTSDLVTLDAADIGKRTHLPLLNIKRLCNAIIEALHADLSVSPLKPGQQHGQQQQQPATSIASTLKHTAASLDALWQTISTLDPDLDRALAGGVPAGYVTEITGESGAGKSQFLLTLLLAVQLPPPHGLGRPAMYISTEAPMSTRRLYQIMAAHPTLNNMDPADRPSLDNIISTETADLESQDHILTYQVPVAIERRNIGLLVLDSVATNFRAEFERSAGQASNMGARSTELVRLGMHLHHLACKYNLAVVVANQVADRFGSTAVGPGSSSGFGPKTPVIPSSSTASRHHHHHHALGRSTQESPLATRSRPIAEISNLPSSLPPQSTMPPPPAPSAPPATPYHHPYNSSPDPAPALLLDHQQRWFTGWGDDPFADYALKTPSLGLVWSTQIAARIALFKRAVYTRRTGGRWALDDDDPDNYQGRDDEEEQVAALQSWQRWMKVVFAPHAAASGPGLDGLTESVTGGAVEFEVTMGGVRAVKREREAG